MIFVYNGVFWGKVSRRSLARGVESLGRIKDPIVNVPAKGLSRRWTPLVLVALALIKLDVAFGQSTTTYPGGESKTQAPQRPKSSDEIADDKKFSAGAQFESLEYLTSVSESPELTRNQFFSGRFVYSSVGLRPKFSENLRVSSAPSQVNLETDNRLRLGQWAWKTDLMAGTYFREKMTHGMVNELYGSWGITEKLEVSIGRRNFLWSFLDSNWRSGLWQSQFAMDALRPSEQGLTGAFARVGGPKLSLLVFGSGIFIPSVGPDIREEGGSLKSESRWYRQPTQSFQLAKNVSRVTYRLDIPEAQKLASQWSAGASLQTLPEKNEDGFIGIYSTANKPINDLVLTRNSSLRNEGEQDSLRVVVVPDVARHQIQSLDLGYRWGPSTWVFSYLTDQPKVSLPRAEWVSQRISPLYMYSAVTQWSFDRWWGRGAQLQVGYLRSFGGQIKDIESNGGDNEITLFSQRQKFSHLVQISADADYLGPWSKSMSSKIYYNFDWDQMGSLLGFETRYGMTKDLHVLFGFDFLGVNDPLRNPDSFLNQYRANDRVFAGLSYVF